MNKLVIVQYQLITGLISFHTCVSFVKYGKLQYACIVYLQTRVQFVITVTVAQRPWIRVVEVVFGFEVVDEVWTLVMSSTASVGIFELP